MYQGSYEVVKDHWSENFHNALLELRQLRAYLYLSWSIKQLILF